ncbi:peptidylprolyl isomerase [Candidatus Woesearchaeota archaeon]|nr:peptidylprolyl isomerase [Candidatus Woesearchaeota archaeon]
MSDKSAKENDLVRVDYKGTLEDGKVFDTSEGRQPIEFKIGEHKVIRGFEDAVIGMKVGDKKDIRLSPEQAYGQRVDELMQEVPKAAFGDKLDPEKGMTLALKAPTGQVIPATVVDVKDDKVKLDLNHPLAGRALNFSITLVSIG